MAAIAAKEAADLRAQLLRPPPGVRPRSAAVRWVASTSEQTQGILRQYKHGHARVDNIGRYMELHISCNVFVQVQAFGARQLTNYLHIMHVVQAAASSGLSRHQHLVRLQTMPARCA